MSQSDPEACVDLAVPRRAPSQPCGLGVVLALSDAAVLSLLGWASLVLLLPMPTAAEDEQTWRAVATGLLLVPLVKSLLGTYGLGRLEYAERLRRTLQGALLVGSMLVVPAVAVDGFAAFFLQALGVAGVGFVATAAADILLVHGLLAALPSWRTPTVIVGAGPLGAAAAEMLQRLPWLGLDPVGFFDDAGGRTPDRLAGLPVAGLPVIGPVRLLQASPAYAGLADAAIVAVEPGGMAATELARSLPFRQVYCLVGGGSAAAAGIGAGGLEASCHGVPGFLALRLGVRPQGAYRALRRALDIAGAGGLLLLFGPLMLLVAAAIRLDSRGPVLFRQTRWAGGEGTFGCLKFRSMHVDAEAQLQRLLAGDPVLRQEYETYHKLSHDPRITRVGRFLRKTSLDELPQLWNILIGEMSLIGPRAYMPRELPEVGAAAAVIGTVRPGLTGYWQVTGRHRTTFQERVAMDVFYVRHGGLLFDLHILARTVLLVLRADGS